MNQIKKVYELLEAAKALIDTPEKWTQKDFAKKADGKSTTWQVHNQPVCFCTLGALYNTISKQLKNPPELVSLTHKAERILTDVILELFPTSDRIKDPLEINTRKIVNFNDSHTHQEVMAVWDHAIFYARNKDI